MTQHIIATANILQKPINEALSLIHKIALVIAGIPASIRKAKEVNAAIRELNSLSDAELRDIGIARGDIYSIAAGHVDMTRSREIDAEVNDNLKGFV